MAMILVFNAVNKLIIVAMNVLLILFAMYLTVELTVRFWFQYTRSHIICGICGHQNFYTNNE